MESKRKQQKFNQMTSKQLQAALVSKQGELEKFLKKKLLGKVEKSADLVKIRKDIARIKTFMTIKKTLENTVRAEPQAKSRTAKISR
jgi:ribosomal protein L29